mgnify:CR=1 FL=1
MQESLTLQPIARVDGTINLPGSKSVSNRALLLAALALFLLAGAPGCMAQRMAWSARGTMIFLPSGF